MNANSDPVEFLEKMDEEIKSYEGNIKTEVEETNNYEPPQRIREKRHFNEKKSDLENQNKKIKEEFVVFEELDYKQQPEEINEIHFDDLNNQVI